MSGRTATTSTSTTPSRVRGSVTATYGEALPEGASLAVGQLACEIAKAAAGGDCKLPAGVQQLVRQGVTISYPDVGELFRQGRTGLVPGGHVHRDVEPVRAAAALAGVLRGPAKRAEGGNMITGPLKWYTVASTLEQAVYAELTTKPDRHGVVPGAIAWDECDCGILAVSVAQVFLSESFPDQAARPVGNCDAPYEVGEVVIQVVRCAPNPEDPLTAPTVAELDASAQEVLRDAYEMLEGRSR